MNMNCVKRKVSHASMITYIYVDYMNSEREKIKL